MPTYRIPMPPSTNALYKNAGKKRLKTEHYRAWITAAGWELKAQPRRRIGGPVSLQFTVPLSCRIDLDNCLKAAIDLLVDHDLIDDDRNVAEIGIRKATGDKMVVIVTQSDYFKGIDDDLYKTALTPPKENQK